MKPAIACVLLLMTLVRHGALAQPCAANVCAWQKQMAGQLMRTSVADAKEDDYDVQYVKINLSISDTSSYINGNVTTRAKVVAVNMSKYCFELSDTLQIDSVKVNGAIHGYTRAQNVCTVHLADALTQNNTFTAQVFYHGYPPLLSPYYTSGFRYDTTYHITYSLAEPYQAWFWWPCKQSLTDKIDSTDTWITVPAGVKAGSNGALSGITPVGAGRRYEWKERYPIDYYLVSVAVSKYRDTSYYMHFSGSDDSMVIINYLYAPRADSLRKIADSAAMMIDYFSTLIGRYPFWQEKYGHCYTPPGISMENQTMTSTNLVRTSVVAHELMHQWFGDHVTCATWHDIWLNEGFASYAEYLFYDHFNSPAAARDHMDKVHANVYLQDQGSVYVYDTTSAYRIFDGPLTYNKGESVVHMLRTVINNDSLFFKVLHNYQQQYAFATATTANLQAVAEQTTGLRLDTFFSQWVYGEGFPLYTLRWNQVGDVLFLHLDQQPSWPSSVSCFATPVDIQLYSQQGDTVIRIYNDHPAQLYQLLIDRTVDSVRMDPARWLLHKELSAPARDTTLDMLPARVTIYPNPVGNTLYIAYKALTHPAFVLYTADGRVVMRRDMQYPSGIEVISLPLLPVGDYIYNVLDGSRKVKKGKLFKK